MKTVNKIEFSVLAVFFLFAGAFISTAQQTDRKWENKSKYMALMNIPGLTDDQAARIKSFYVEHLKTVKPLKNQMRENRAHYKTLMSADKPDMMAINANIDEYGRISTDLLKLRARHIQDTRSVLNDDQKTFFDVKAERWHHRHGMMRRGDDNQDAKKG